MFDRTTTINRQRGVTLLETVIALSVMALIFVGLTQLANQYSDDTRAIVAAQHLRTVGEAAKPYIKDNYAAIEAVATDTTPALITVPMMSASGHLQVGFNHQNGYGQHVCVLVLKPEPGRLYALVVSESPAGGGAALDDLTLAQMVSTVGAAGGGIYSTAPTAIMGTMGAWNTPIGAFSNANHMGRRCDGTTGGTVSLTAGHGVMALWFENGDSTASFLYRDEVPGRPDLNRMNTTLNMGGNRVSGLHQVGTIGSACGAGVNVGDLASGPAGELLTCQGGVWRTQGSAFWQDPVTTFANLPACNAAIQGQTRVVRNAADGANRARAYTCYGTAWQALGLDNSGNLIAPGYVRATQGFQIAGTTIVDPSRNLTNINNATINGLARFNGNVQVGNMAIGSAGTTTATGTLAAATAEIKLIVTENTSCGTRPSGTVARDTAGLLLSCQSGTWKRAGGSGGGSAPIVRRCQGTAPGGVSCPIPLPAGNWRLLLYAAGHASNFPGGRILVDGVVIASSADLGDPSGTSYTVTFGTVDVVGGRTVPAAWQLSDTYRPDHTLMVTAYPL